MRKNTPFLLFIALFCIFTTHGYAKNAVIGLDLEYRLRQDGTGHYNQMWGRLNELGLSKPLAVSPLKRAFRDFSAAKQSCLFPTTIESLKGSFPQFKDANLISSKGVDYVVLRVMTKKGTPIITDMNQLNGKRVAIWNGLDPNIYLKGVNASVETTTDEAVRLKMLYNDRVDAVLGFIPDTFLAADALGIEPPEYDDNLNFFSDHTVALVCFDSPENRKTIQSFDKHLSTLKNNGELKTILGPHVIFK